MRTNQPPRYLPLRRYLTALPAAQHEVRLSFTELEAILDHPLPASAGTTGYWSHSSTARGNWGQDDWRAQLHAAALGVIFTRTGAAP